MWSCSGDPRSAFEHEAAGVRCCANQHGEDMTINNSEAEILDAVEEQAQDLNQGVGAVEQVEAAIRDFVRQDVTHVRRVPAPDQPTEVVASVNSLVQRVAGASPREKRDRTLERG